MNLPATGAPPPRITHTNHTNHTTQTTHEHDDYYYYNYDHVDDHDDAEQQNCRSQQTLCCSTIQAGVTQCPASIALSSVVGILRGLLFHVVSVIRRDRRGCHKGNVPPRLVPRVFLQRDGRLHPSLLWVPCVGGLCACHTLRRVSTWHVDPQHLSVADQCACLFACCLASFRCFWFCYSHTSDRFLTSFSVQRESTLTSAFETHRTPLVTPG